MPFLWFFFLRSCGDTGVRELQLLQVCEALRPLVTFRINQETVVFPDDSLGVS